MAVRHQNTGRESLAVRQLVLATNGTGKLDADSTGNLRYSKGLALSGETTDVITQNSTALLLAGGLALSGEATDVITQDSTAVIFAGAVRITAASAVLSGRKAPGTLMMVGNSTGNMLAVNTTGTTWKYLNVTSVLA